MASGVAAADDAGHGRPLSGRGVLRPAPAAAGCRPLWPSWATSSGPRSRRPASRRSPRCRAHRCLRRSRTLRPSARGPGSGRARPASAGRVRCCRRSATARVTTVRLELQLGPGCACGRRVRPALRSPRAQVRRQAPVVRALQRRRRRRRAARRRACHQSVVASSASAATGGSMRAASWRESSPSRGPQRRAEGDAWSATGWGSVLALAQDPAGALDVDRARPARSQRSDR